MSPSKRYQPTQNYTVPSVVLAVLTIMALTVSTVLTDAPNSSANPKHILRMLTAVQILQTNKLETIQAWNCPLCARFQAQNIRVFSLGQGSGFVAHLPSTSTILVALKPMAESTASAIPMKDYPSCRGCKIHPGYAQFWDQVRSQLIGIVDGFKKISPKDSIAVTGFGGSGPAALLLGIDFLARFHGLVSVTTFDSPRPGNSNFALFVDANLHAHFRVVNQRDDLVSSPKQFLGYQHSGFELWFKGVVTEPQVCQSSNGFESDTCHNQLSSFTLKMADRALDKYVRAVSLWMDSWMKSNAKNPINQAPKTNSSVPSSTQPPTQPVQPFLQPPQISPGLGNQVVPPLTNPSTFNPMPPVIPTHIDNPVDSTYAFRPLPIMTNLQPSIHQNPFPIQPNQQLSTQTNQDHLGINLIGTINKTLLEEEQQLEREEEAFRKAQKLKHKKRTHLKDDDEEDVPEEDEDDEENSNKKKKSRKDKLKNKKKSARTVEDEEEEDAEEPTSRKSKRKNQPIMTDFKTSQPFRPHPPPQQSEGQRPLPPMNNQRFETQQFLSKSSQNNRFDDSSPLVEPKSLMDPNPQSFKNEEVVSDDEIMDLAEDYLKEQKEPAPKQRSGDELFEEFGNVPLYPTNDLPASTTSAPSSSTNVVDDSDTQDSLDKFISMTDVANGQESLLSTSNSQTDPNFPPAPPAQRIQNQPPKGMYTAPRLDQPTVIYQVQLAPQIMRIPNYTFKQEISQPNGQSTTMSNIQYSFKSSPSVPTSNSPNKALMNQYNTITNQINKPTAINNMPTITNVPTNIPMQNNAPTNTPMQNNAPSNTPIQNNVPKAPVNNLPSSNIQNPTSTITTTTPAATQSTVSVEKKMEEMQKQMLEMMNLIKNQNQNQNPIENSKSITVSNTEIPKIVDAPKIAETPKQATQTVSIPSKTTSEINDQFGSNPFSDDSDEDPEINGDFMKNNSEISKPKVDEKPKDSVNEDQFDSQIDSPIDQLDQQDQNSITHQASESKNEQSLTPVSPKIDDGIDSLSNYEQIPDSNQDILIKDQDKEPTKDQASITPPQAPKLGTSLNKPTGAATTSKSTVGSVPASQSPLNNLADSKAVTSPKPIGVPKPAISPILASLSKLPALPFGKSVPQLKRNDDNFDDFEAEGFKFNAQSDDIDNFDNQFDSELESEKPTVKPALKVEAKPAVKPVKQAVKPVTPAAKPAVKPVVKPAVTPVTKTAATNTKAPVASITKNAPTTTKATKTSTKSVVPAKTAAKAVTSTTKSALSTTKPVAGSTTTKLASSAKITTSVAKKRTARVAAKIPAPTTKTAVKTITPPKSAVKAPAKKPPTHSIPTTPSASNKFSVHYGDEEGPSFSLPEENWGGQEIDAEIDTDAKRSQVNKSKTPTSDELDEIDF